MCLICQIMIARYTLFYAGIHSQNYITQKIVIQVEYGFTSGEKLNISILNFML